jgi:hypothetical protein
VRTLVLALLIAPACVPVPVYRVQRTARVPHPAAPLRSGAPLEGPVELSVGASNAFDTRAPRLADPDASVEVPRTQVRGELRVRVGHGGEIAAIHEQAVETTFAPLDRTQAPVGGDTAWSMGLAVRYAVHFDEAPELYVGLGLEALQWMIPYVEYRSCVENCEGVPQQEVTHGSENIPVLAYSITPTYRSGPLTFYAGLYAAPHPTIVRKGEELSAIDYDSEVTAGAYNYVLHAGAQVRLGAITILAQVQNDVTRAPVWYGPSFGLAVAVHLPDRVAHRLRRYIPPPPPPPPSEPEPDDRGY